MTIRVCFVCLGNICRSPIAEIVMRRMLEERGLDKQVQVSSAGTGDWHVGDSADERTLAVLAKHGYDGSQHRARQFVAETFADNDLVVVMDKNNLDAVRRLVPAGDDKEVRLLREFEADADGTDVPDPYYGGAQGFDDVLVMVEAACRGLVDRLADDLRR